MNGGNKLKFIFSLFKSMYKHKCISCIESSCSCYIVRRFSISCETSTFPNFVFHFFPKNNLNIQLNSLFIRFDSFDTKQSSVQKCERETCGPKSFLTSISLLQCVHCIVYELVIVSSYTVYNIQLSSTT